MKVLIVHHSNLIGGAGNSMIELVKTLKKNNPYLKISVLLPKTNHSEISKKLKLLNINHTIADFEVGMIPLYSGGTNIFSPSMIKNLKNIFLYKKNIKKIIDDYDLIFLNSITTSWITLISSKPQIVYVRETLPVNFEFLCKKIYSIFLQRAFKNIFISNYDASKFDSVQKTIIYNSYEHKQIKKPIPRSNTKILFMGGYSRIKGLNLILKSLIMLKKYDIEFTILGYNKLNKRKISYWTYAYWVEKKIKFLKKYLKINLVGNVSDISPYLNNCDFVIINNRFPHQSRPIFEAGFYKKPVIISDHKNYNEFVIHNNNGLLFRSKNKYSLKNQILEYLTFKEKIMRHGENNFEKSISNHSAEIYAKQIQILLDEL